MNPALLLDPRRARERGNSSSRQTNGHAVPQLQQFSPHNLLNPKSAAKRPASGAAAGEHGHERGRPDADADADLDAENVAGPGQVSLVERLHNVQERTASPAKRVRTEEKQRKGPASSSFGGGGALDLQRREGEPVSTRVPEPIDLTMSDDDEVQVVADNSDGIICIGKLKNTYIQAHCVPFPDPKKYHGNHGVRGRIRIAFRRGGGNVIAVTDPTGQEFGKVDIKTAVGLCPLMDASASNKLSLLGCTDQRRRQPNEGESGSPFSGLVSMTLQLYCPRKYAHQIGKYLMQRKMELLAPTIEVQRHDYWNPQTNQGATVQDFRNGNVHSEIMYQQQSAQQTSNYTVRSVEEIRSDVANVFDQVVGATAEVPMREPPSVIKTGLYPHQKQALWFMWDKEQDHSAPEFDNRKDSIWQPKYRDNGRKYYLHIITGQEVEQKPRSALGGILADEMGLGKTLSILSLIADTESMAAAKHFATHKKPPPQRGITGIVPTVNSRATLLICPLSTMTNWKEQIREHFPEDHGSLRWFRYHGTERFNVSAKELADYDIVVTTYNIVARDIADRKRALPFINWFRIVLDEAHMIRNQTGQSKATCALPGERRWAVTGTPVQNRLEDLGALFNFIRLAPFNTATNFNHYILNPFKQADPEVITKLQLLVSTVTIRRTKDIIKDEVPGRIDNVVMLEFSKEERRLHDWFEQDTQRKVNAVTAGDKMAGKSYARILTAITNLRLICAHGRELLSDEALKTTDGMTYDNPMEVDNDDDEPPALTPSQAYEMLELLDHTSAADCAYCDTSIMDTTDSDDEDDGAAAAATADTLGYMTSCYHIVCTKHIKTLRSAWARLSAASNGYVACPLCEDRNRPVAFELQRSAYRDYLDERERLRRDPKLAKKINTYTGPSTKVKALLADLDESRAWSQAHPEQRPIKSIVFSSWTTHLDLIELALTRHSHSYTRLDGRMPRAARDAAIALFRTSRAHHTMLVSIGAGGLGLNLTTASRVFMMEPQFNPAAEAQAVDRVHRLGQEREVRIKRFVMRGSFEEKMVELQGRKRKLAALTMERGRSAGGRGGRGEEARRRLEELRGLFR